MLRYVIILYVVFYSFRDTIMTIVTVKCIKIRQQELLKKKKTFEILRCCSYKIN